MAVSANPPSVASSAVMMSAAVVASAIGLVFYNVLPLFLGTLQDSAGFANDQLGLIAAGIFLGFNLSGLSSYFWIKRVSPFLACGAAFAGMVALLLLSAFTSSFPPFLCVAVMIGLASGVLASVAAAVIGRATNANKWFGFKTAAESMVGVVLLFVLPATLIPRFGFSGVVFGVVILLVCLSPLIFWLSKKPLSDFVSQSGSREAGASFSSSDAGVKPSSFRAGRHAPAYWALASMVAFFIGASSIWAFLERIAVARNFDAATIGILIGVTLFCSVLAPLVAGAAPARIGYLKPFLAGCALLLIGTVEVTLSSNFALFAMGACLYMLGWSGALPFSYSMIVAADTDGRHIALAPFAFGVGSMIGPMVGGYLFVNGSTAPLLALMVISLAVAIVAAWKSQATAMSNPGRLDAEA